MDNSNSIPDSISCPEGSFPDENDICINCTNNCKNYELNSCNCSSSHNNYYIYDETNKSRECNTICDEYVPNKCIYISWPLNYEMKGENCVECTGWKIMKLVLTPVLIVLKHIILIIINAKNIMRNVLLI